MVVIFILVTEHVDQIDLGSCVQSLALKRETKKDKEGVVGK